jgi:hypothetical protein
MSHRHRGSGFAKEFKTIDFEDFNFEKRFQQQRCLFEVEDGEHPLYAAAAGQDGRG